MRIQAIFKIDYDVDTKNYGTDAADEICAIELAAYSENPYSMFDKYMVEEFDNLDIAVVPIAAVDNTIVERQDSDVIEEKPVVENPFFKK